MLNALRDEVAAKRGRFPLAAIILSRQARVKVSQPYQDTPYDRFMWNHVGSPSGPETKAVEKDGVILSQRVLSVFNLRRIVQVTGTEGKDLFAVKSLEIATGAIVDWTVRAPEKKKSDLGKSKTTLWLGREVRYPDEEFEPWVDLVAGPPDTAQLTYTEGFPVASFLSAEGQ